MMATSGTDFGNGYAWFCVSSRSGLGHLRRSVQIAQALKATGAAPPLGLMTNASPDGLEAYELALFDSVCICERDQMAGRLLGCQPSAVVADTIRIPSLHELSCAVVLVLRETPKCLVPTFALANRLWDLALVPNPAQHWYLPEVRDLALRSRAVGWIYRPVKSSVGRISDQPVLLVCSGGGGNPQTRQYLANELEPVLSAVRRELGAQLQIVQVLGPRAPADARLTLTDQLLDVGGALHQWLPCADVLISTVGYNSVLEIAQTSVPTLLTPIPRTIDDQAERANRWAPSLGLLHQAGQAERSANWIAQSLRQQERRNAVSLGPSGEARAAAEILALLS